MQPLIDLTFQELELLPLLVIGNLLLVDPAVDCLFCRPVGEVIAELLKVEPVITIRLLDGRSSDHLLQVVHLCDEVVHCIRDVIEGNRLFIHGKKMAIGCSSVPIEKSTTASTVRQWCKYRKLNKGVSGKRSVTKSLPSR